jgi:hypothetical protein
MAEVKNIKINVDTKQATQAMDDLAKATHDVSASFEEVYGDLQPLTTRMGEAEDRLYELANAGQTATQEYKDLLTTVGNYRKVQIQTDMAVDAAASTMANKLGGALGGATAGFQLVQGAMGAFGAESAQVEEALLKVQSAMAIADGVKGFREAIPSIKAFGSAMKAAIGSTGIGLLVVALGTLVAYWDDIKAAVSGVSDEQSRLNQKTDANVLAQQAKYDAISGQDNILKLQGKSERDILKIKQTQIQAVIKATEAQLVNQEATKKAQVMAARRNREILTGILTFLTAPLQLLLGTVDMVGKALGKDFNLRQGLNKSITSLVFDPEETAEEGDKVINETKAKLAQLKNESAGFTIALKEMDKPAEKVVKDEAKKVDTLAKINSDAKRMAIEKENEFQQKLEDIAEQNYQNSLSEQEREIRLIQDKYFELETIAQGNAQALQDIEIAKLNEINDVNLKYQQQAYEAEKAAKEKQKELDAKSDQDKIDAQKAVAETLATIRQQDFNNIEAGLDLVSSLFENNKKIQAAVLVAENAVGIAKTIVNTQAANQLARAQGTALAIASGGASVAAAEALVVRNNIGAGISIAAQIAATAKGLSALKAGGSPASGSVSGGGGGGGGMTPNFNVVGNSGMNQLAQIQQTPIQAYVVSGEVTSAQALDRNRVKNATL